MANAKNYDARATFRHSLQDPEMRIYNNESYTGHVIFTEAIPLCL